MADIWIVAWHEYRTNVRRRGFIIATLLPPIIIFVLMLIILAMSLFAGWTAGRSIDRSDDDSASTSFSTKKTGLVDHSGYFTPLSTEFDDVFEPFQSESAAEQAFLANRIRFYVVIPENYLETGKALPLSDPEHWLKYESANK